MLTRLFAVFGPDICGRDINRIHAIFADKSGTALLKKDEIKLANSETDEYTHLYTLIVRPDHTYQVGQESVLTVCELVCGRRLFVRLY